MCLYDVKRSKSSQTVTYVTETTLAALRTLVAGANANRTRVVLTAYWTDATTPHETVQLRVGGDSGPAVAAVSQNSPFAVARLEDVGLGLLGPIYLYHDGAADVIVNVTGVELLTNDELQ